MRAAEQVKQLSLSLAILAMTGIAAGLFPLSSAGQNRGSRPAQTATIHWDQVPLGDALRRATETYGATIFLDRRVDPTQRISVDTHNADVATTMQETAAAAHLGVSRIGTLFYLGPTTTTDELRTLVALRSEEIARLPANIRGRLTQKRPLKWPRLAEPGSLVAAEVTQRGWQIAADEQIPFDLWPEGELPTLTAAEQLTVLLAGFDLTFRARDGSATLDIVPISDAALLTRRYRLRYGEADMTRLRQQFPDLTMQLAGDYASVEARLEDHERLAAWLAGAQPRTNASPAGAAKQGPTKQVYTLRVQEQPVETVISALQQRLNFQLDIDAEAIRAAGLSLEKRVSFAVENVSQDDLLKAVLEPAGLAFRRDGQRIKIVPK